MCQSRASQPGTAAGTETSAPVDQFTLPVLPGCHSNDYATLRYLVTSNE